MTIAAEPIKKGIPSVFIIERLKYDQILVIEITDGITDQRTPIGFYPHIFECISGY